MGQVAQELWVYNVLAGAAVTKFRIVKYGSNDNEFIQGAAATDKVCGVADAIGAEAAGDPLDVVRSGLARVEYGGTITRGDMLVSDANGKAVAAAPSAGTNNRSIGIAEISGVSGDIGIVDVRPQQIQG